MFLKRMLLIFNYPYRFFSKEKKTTDISQRRPRITHDICEPYGVNSFPSDKFRLSNQKEIADNNFQI